MVGRGIAVTGGLALGSMLIALKQYSTMNDSSGHTVKADIIRAQYVVPLKGSPYTSAIIEYQPYADEPSKCQVAVRLAGKYVHLVEGDRVEVIPRKVSCYQPILPTDLPTYGEDLAMFAISFPLFLLLIWVSVRQFRRAVAKRAAARAQALGDVQQRAREPDDS